MSTEAFKNKVKTHAVQAAYQWLNEEKEVPRK